MANCSVIQLDHLRLEGVWFPRPEHDPSPSPPMKHQWYNSVDVCSVEQQLAGSFSSHFSNPMMESFLFILFLLYFKNFLHTHTYNNQSYQI